MNNQELQKKTIAMTVSLLKEKGYISFVDLFMKLEYLDLKDYEKWRKKKIPYLERVIKVNLKKISFIMKTIRKNCENSSLKASWTTYKSWGKGQKVTLRFSKNGNINIEELYSTHFVKTKKAKEERMCKQGMHIRQ